MAYGETGVQPLPQMNNKGWMYWPRARLVILVVTLLQLALGIGLGVAPLTLVMTMVLVTLIVKVNAQQFGYEWVSDAYANQRERRRTAKLGPYRTKALREVIYRDDFGAKHTKPLAAPVEPGFIPLEGGKSGFLAEVRSPTGDHTLYAILDGYGAAASGNPDDLQAANQILVEALKEMGAEYGIPGLFVALTYARVPTNMTEAAAFVESYGAEVESELGRQLRANLAEALANQADLDGDVFLLLAVSAPRPRSWNKARTPADISTRDILEAPAYKLIELLLDRFQMMGSANPRRPTPFEAITRIHGTLDPSTIEALYLDTFADNERMKTGALTFEQSLTVQRGILPHDWEPKPTYLRIGDTLTRMFFVPNYPDPLVEAGIMRALVNAPEDIWYGVTMAYETLNTDSEMRRMGVRRRERDTRRYERNASGRSATVADIDRAELEEQQEQIQYYSRGGVIKLNTIAWVSSESAAGLNAAEARLARIFRSTGLSLQRVAGESLQIPTRLMVYGIKSESV